MAEPGLWESARQALGWVPAVVFPLASLVQLVVLVRTRDGRGVSAITWSLFAIANVCLWLYMENRMEWQAVATALCTASVQVAVVVLAMKWRKAETGREVSSRQP
jgi:uncharacterized protein with PQ loop repeat